MRDRLPQRTLGDYLPALMVAFLTAALIVSSTWLAYQAGTQTYLQPCLAGRLDSGMVRSDSLVRILRDGRLR